MVWTGGVAIALTVGRAIKHLSTSAWNRTVPYNPQEMVLGPIDFITAFVYGTCATLFLFAVVSKDFWKSPGKISLMIFTLICLIDWGLSTFAYTMIVQNVTRFGCSDDPDGVRTGRRSRSKTQSRWLDNDRLHRAAVDEFHTVVGLVNY